MSCDHIIGILYCVDDSILITLDGLKKEIADTKIDNRMCERDGMEWLKRPEWTLHDYTDGRKSTNLHRFMFCPECGEKIDWKAIRKEEVTP